MSATTHDGGPAFPIKGFAHDASGALSGEYMVNPGMTLRDYFAAKAMQAMVGTYRHTLSGEPGESTTTSPHRELMLDTDIHTGEHLGAKEIANDAYAIADAMIAARNAGGGQ